MCPGSTTALEAISQQLGLKKVDDESTVELSNFLAAIVDIYERERHHVCVCACVHKRASVHVCA